MNPTEVSGLAQLALINLTEEEAQQYAADITSLMGVVESVAASASEEIAATSHPQSLSNVWREDTPGETLSRDVVLDAAPAAEDGRFAVPQILGEDA